MIAAILVGAYLVGSIPFGLMLARAGGVDIRTKGSGNIGATNVWRVMGWKYGLTCFVLDVLKGLGPTLAAGWAVGAFGNAALIEGLSPTGAVLVQLGAAVGAILGHMFPVWLKFKGGKGVATSFGALVGVWPVFTLATLAAFGVWLVSARLTRMVGISSCIAALVLMGAVMVEVLWPRWGLSAMVAGSAGTGRAGWVHAAFACALGGLVIYKHRTNIARTLAGTENRIGGAKARGANGRP